MAEPLIAEVQRGRAPARAAEDKFTAMVPADGYQSFAFCRRVLLAFEEAGVPPDATIQWSHPTIYAHWRREVLDGR